MKEIVLYPNHRFTHNYKSPTSQGRIQLVLVVEIYIQKY